MMEQPLPNSPQSLKPLVASSRISLRRVLGMLVIRSALPFALLLGLAAVFAIAGRRTPIAASAAWWLWFVTITNVVCLILLIRFGRAEGIRLRDLYFARRASWKGDLLWVLIASVGIALLALPPGTWLAGVLWDDPTTPNAMLFQPLPSLAAYGLLILFPIPHGLTELPTYWGYVAPRLRAFGWGRLGVVLLVGTGLSVQHMFFAFQLDWRYDLWLAVKFLPFAIWTGIVIDRRPTVLPYLMTLHALLDSVLPYFVLTA